MHEILTIWPEDRQKTLKTNCLGLIFGYCNLICMCLPTQLSWLYDVAQCWRESKFKCNWSKWHFQYNLLLYSIYSNCHFMWIFCIHLTPNKTKSKSMLRWLFYDVDSLVEYIMSVLRPFEAMNYISTKCFDWIDQKWWYILHFILIWMSHDT